MKKFLMILGIGSLLFIVGFSGCTQQRDSSDQSPVSTTPPTTESLETILAKTDSISSLSYEVTAVITMPQLGTQTATVKIWQKLPYIKEQVTSSISGTASTVTIIHRPEGNYTYDTVQQKYVLAPNVSSFASSLHYFDSQMIKEYLANQSLTTFETTTIEGKQATIIHFNPLQGDTQMNITLWIWNDKGLPLKAHIDMTMEQTTMNMDFTFTNYSFADIPESTFSIT
jgi:outer membrane lipoprotein-sorting protein